MDAFINTSLDLLHYVLYIKEEKVNIQQFLRCLPPIFWDKIEFDMPKTLDIALHKTWLYYEHGNLRQEKLNRNQDKSKNFSNSHKTGLNPQPNINQNNSFQANKNFNRSDTKPYVPSANVNKPVASGANATPLHIKCWKFNGPHYARDCKNKIGGVLHNLQEESNVQDTAKTPRIYAALDGRKEDHQATMVEIEGKILNTSVSIVIDPGACRSYVAPKIVDICKIGKVKHENLGWFS